MSYRDAASAKQPNPCRFSLERGTMFSSRSQNSDEPPSLLYTLLAVSSVVLAVWFLSKLKTPIQKIRHPIEPQDYTEGETANPKQKGANPIPSETNSPPSPSNEWKSRKKRRSPLDLIRLGIEVAALFGLAWYVSETHRTNNLTQQTLDASDRPRVALDNREDEGIVFSEGPDNMGANNATTILEFRLTYLLKNFGRSAAYVEVLAELVDKNYPIGINVDTLVQRKCDSDEALIRAAKRQWFTTIVQQMGYNQPLQLKITDAMKKDGFVRPTIVGCIWYRSTTTGIIYKTPFSGQISMSTDDSGKLAQDMSPVKIPIALVHNHPRPRIRVVDVLVMSGTS